MTTALAGRSVVGLRRRGRAAARRAMARWAWRMFRREWRRQALILVLLALAVAATVFGLAVVTNAAGLGPDPVFGTANTVITLPGTDQDLSGDLAALRTRFGAVDVTRHASIPIPGSVSDVDLRAENPHGRLGSVTLRLDSGRYPSAAGEVAVTHEVAAEFGLRIGSTWDAAGHALRVVGIAENPLNLLDQFALLPPGQISSPSQVSVLLDAGSGALQSFRAPSGTGLSVSRRGTQGAAPADAIVLLLGTLGLIFVGLMAVAGFAVVAQRRLRSLGMLGSLGATSRHVRLVMLANGAAVGAVSALLGAGTGVVAWLAFAPTLQSVLERHVDRFSLPWPAVAAAMALTFATAVVAAWWPARAASRLSVMAALSGRPPRPQPSHRFAASGGILLAAGLVLLAFADQRRAVFIITGTVATAVGLLLLSPLAIRAIAVLGRRSGVVVRLAMRDLARYQARSGAALGAVTLAVGIAATIAISSSAADMSTGPGNLPSNQLMLYLSPAGGMSQIPPLSAAQQSGLGTSVSRAASAIDAAALVPLYQAYSPEGGTWPAVQGGPGGGQPAGYATANLSRIVGVNHGEEITSPHALYVATPALLSFYGLQPSEVAPGADVLTSRTGLTDLQVFTPSDSARGGPGSVPVPAASTPQFQIDHRLPGYSSAPDNLITAHAMQSLGLREIPAGWLIQAKGPLTAAQIDTVRRTAAASGLYIETRKPQKSEAPLRNWSTAAGILLALGVLAMTVGLIRSETTGDLRTLAATGASSGVRRALTAATAGALALLGALIGTAGAYGALLAWHRSNLDPLGRVPAVNLVLILAGLPLVAVAGGWLMAGRQPPALGRRPIE